MDFSFLLDAFSTPRQFSQLEEDLSLYEEEKNQILRKRLKRTNLKSSITYLCREKIHCSFSLVFSLEKDQNGIETAFLQLEKSHPVHSHPEIEISEMDFESMRRGFRKLNQPILKVILKEKKTPPMALMNELVTGNHLTEKMKILRKKHPVRFKKCLDNQTNRIKRSIWGKICVPFFDESTIKLSQSSASFFSNENYGLGETFLLETGKAEDKNEEEEVTKIIQEEEEEKEEEEWLNSVIYKQYTFWNFFFFFHTRKP